MDFLSYIKRAFQDIMDFICPEICLGCGNRIHRYGERQICYDCLKKLPKVDHYKIEYNKIHDYFWVNSIEIEYGSCFLQFTKESPTQSLIHNIKYYGHPDLGVRLGRIAGQEMKKHGRFSDIDFIIPVPMHPKKQKKRGFNQAEKIGEGMSEILDIPIKNGILIKTKNTGSQTKMNKEQRMENSSKIFSYANKDLEDTNHYLIIDDVFTTGSTLLVCASKLKESRPNCRISIFALAKA